MTETKKIQNFRIVLDALSGGELTTVVPRDILLQALDSYTAKGHRWVVVPA